MFFSQVKLVHHTYSGLFGTFTCNNAQERYNEKVYQKTVSFWAYVENEKENFINYLYLPKQEVLRLSARVKDLVFWNELYAPVQSPQSNNDITTAGNTRLDDDRDDYENDSMNETLTNTNMETNLDYKTAITNCLSQSKSDLTRSISVDSIKNLQLDNTNNQDFNLSPNSVSESKVSPLVKHHSLDNLNNDQFNMPPPPPPPPTSDLIEERPLSEKISDDSSCDDNASTKNDRRNIDERFCDDVSAKLDLSEVFDIDGELSVADKSNTQIQQKIIYHKVSQQLLLCYSVIVINFQLFLTLQKMIQSLSQKLQNGRSSSTGNRTNKVYSPEVIYQIF